MFWYKYDLPKYSTMRPKPINWTPAHKNKIVTIKLGYPFAVILPFIFKKIKYIASMNPINADRSPWDVVNLKSNMEKFVNTLNHTEIDFIIL